jgi:hypothetical protein
MTNSNHETVVAETKKRRAPLKVQKSGAEIVAEIESLEEQVNGLNEALVGLDVESPAYVIVKKAFDEKHAELNAALSKIHHS